MSYIKSEEQIERIRRSGKILKSVFDELRAATVVGAIPVKLDELANEAIKKKGGNPSLLGFHPDGADHPFPYTVCISLNDTIVHGRPSEIPIEDGDIISFDLVVDFQGGFSDSAFTMQVGRQDPKVSKLLNVTKEALNAGIAQIKPGNKLGDIGHAIEKTARKSGFNIVEGLGGHGVGNAVHEDPFIFNTGEKGTGIELVPGMVLAIEPMVSMGTNQIIQLPDDSFATADGSLSAQFEHTVLVTKTGHEIITA